MTSSWQKIYVELYKDSLFVWYKKKDDKGNKGNVLLKVWTAYFVARFNSLAVQVVHKQACMYIVFMSMFE